MKKILTKNKFVFSQYFFFYIIEYYGKPVRTDNCFMLIAFSFLLVALCLLLFAYCFLVIAF